jgi:hypothetical protein
VSAYTIAGTFIIGGVGTNGAAVSVWKASRFGYIPAVGGSPPGGSPDATGITTSPSYGCAGAYQIVAPTCEPYYIQIAYTGINYWQYQNPEPGNDPGVQVFDAQAYGALGDNSHDDTTNLQLVLTLFAYTGGGTLFVPYGQYKTTAPLTVYPNTTIQGVGAHASVITSAHTGSTFVSTATVNVSTAVDISIRDIGITNSNGSNTGCAINDNFGTYWSIRNAYISGFKYGIALNQSEAVSIRDCQITGQLTASMWMTNGPSSLPGSSGANYNYTNSITVESCSINPGTGAYCIQDDGGQNHTYREVNFEGGLGAFRIAGSPSTVMVNPYMEAQVSTPIVIATTTSAGNGGLLPTRISIIGGTMSSVGGTVVTGPTSGYLCGVSLHGAFVALAGSGDRFIATGANFPAPGQWDQAFNYIYGSGSLT